MRLFGRSADSVTARRPAATRTDLVVVPLGLSVLLSLGWQATRARWSAAGDLVRVALGIAVMSRFVALSNRLLWRPLANLAERHWQLG